MAASAEEDDPLLVRRPLLHDFVICIPSSPPPSMCTPTTGPHPFPPLHSPLLLPLHPDDVHDHDDDAGCLQKDAMAAGTEASRSRPDLESPPLVRQAAILLLVYLALGLAIYSFHPDHFSGIETHPVIDALYFCIVTMCTIGYGDIAPLTPSTKAFSCVFVLVGFGFIDVLLSGVVNHVLDVQESMILKPATERSPPQAHDGFSIRNFIVDVAKGRMRIRLKVGLAIGVVVLCVATGLSFCSSWRVWIWWTLCIYR